MQIWEMLHATPAERLAAIETLRLQQLKGDRAYGSQA